MRRRRAFVTMLIVAAGIPVPRPPARAPSAEAALVFVHAGRSLAALAPVYALRRPLGLGILPREPYSVEISKDAPGHGVEPLLDLPIDAAGRLGTGAVGSVSRDGEIRRAVRDDFYSAPGVIGVRFDSVAGAVPRAEVLRDALEIARARGVWLLGAPGGSEAAALARSLGIPVLAATDALDERSSTDAVASRVGTLIARARRTGQAVGVARLEGPAPAVIAKLLPAFDRAGVSLVPPSALLR